MCSTRTIKNLFINYPSKTCVWTASLTQNVFTYLFTQLDLFFYPSKLLGPGHLNVKKETPDGGGSGGLPGQPRTYFDVSHVDLSGTHESTGGQRGRCASLRRDERVFRPVLGLSRGPLIVRLHCFTRGHKINKKLIRGTVMESFLRMSRTVRRSPFRSPP